MSVLVDSSVWIEYLRGGPREDGRLDVLITEGTVLINELILAELLPAVLLRRQGRLADLLRGLPALPMTIDWQSVVLDQLKCLRNGINKVGIPDLLIAQNARQHSVALFSLDRHFHLMARHVGLRLFHGAS